MTPCDAFQRFINGIIMLNIDVLGRLFAIFVVVRKTHYLVFIFNMHVANITLLVLMFQFIISVLIQGTDKSATSNFAAC